MPWSSSFQASARAGAGTTPVPVGDCEVRIELGICSIPMWRPEYRIRTDPDEYATSFNDRASRMS